MDLSSLFSGFGGQQSSGNSTGGNDNLLLKLLLGQQPSAGQSLASAVPFLNLPKQQAKYYQPYNNTIDAMTNTSNPMYQQIYSQQKQQGQQNLAEAIAEMSRQNRKLSALGRTPLFSQERGGETQFRGLTQGYQDNQNQAATRTQGILGNAAQGYLQQGNLQSQLAQNKAGISGNIYGGLAKLFGL